MERLDTVLIFSLLLFGLVIVLVLLFRIHESRKKRNISDRFKSFTSRHDLGKNELRAVPRILVPESLDVSLDLDGGSLAPFRAEARDISLSGVSAETRSQLPGHHVNKVFEEVTVKTPINVFGVAELRLVRKENRLRGTFLAFRIERIEEDQFERLKVFLSYLSEFLAHEH